MKRLRQERGMVLLLVLVVVALLAALLTELAFSTLVDLRLTETFRDSTRAWYLAKGGVTVGRIILQEDRNGYDAGDELWAQGVTNYPVGDGVVSIRVEDQAGRLDVNALVAGANVDPAVKRRFYRFFEVVGAQDPEELTAALIDWIDPDDQPYADPDSGAVLGAEADYYRRLLRPHPVKNAPFDSLEELAMVRGFTPELLRTVLPHLTVWGGSTVNVNTASAEVLMSLSEDPLIDRQAAESILARREEEPFRKPEDLQELNHLPGLENLLRTPFGISGSTFRILSSAAVGDGTCRVEAVVEKDGNKLLYQKVN